MVQVEEKKFIKKFEELFKEIKTKKEKKII
jgi:hypothetical protein